MTQYSAEDAETACDFRCARYPFAEYSVQPVCGSLTILGPACTMLQSNLGLPTTVRMRHAEIPRRLNHADHIRFIAAR